MASNFNVNQLLSGVSMKEGATKTEAAERDEPRRPPLKIISLSVHDLVPSSENFYSVDNITELKGSIEMFGVLQNLTVKPIGGGKYEIIAGHRRHRACMELVAEGKSEYEYVPCGLQTERDEIKERILLIMTNSTTRELSDWEKMKQAEELSKHFTALKKRDNLTGRVRDLVAEALNTSATQIARMNAISKNLTPELTEQFREGRLGVSAAYELSGLPEEKQQAAAAELAEKGALSINDVKERKQDAPPNNNCARCGAQLTPDEAHYYETHCEKCERETMQEIHEEAEATPTVPRPEPREYPETPPDFEEGQEDEADGLENRDFADMTDLEKTEVAIDFLNQKRFALFSPGEDTRIFDFILEVLSCGIEHLS